MGARRAPSACAHVLINKELRNSRNSKLKFRNEIPSKDIDYFVKIMQSSALPPGVVASLIYLATFEYTSDIADKIGLAFIAVLVKVLAWTVLLFFFSRAFFYICFYYSRVYQSGRDIEFWGRYVKDIFLHFCFVFRTK